MLQGLAKAKALKELKQLHTQKESLKGLSLAKALKRIHELRKDLGMGKKQDTATAVSEYVDTLIFNQDRKMLLVQRHAQDDFMPNKWWFVGGKLEHGETVEQGAIRELKEETGIKLPSLTLVEKKTFDNGSISHRFIGTVQNDVVIHLAKDELQDYRWVSIDELSQFDLVGNLSDLQSLSKQSLDLLGDDNKVTNNTVSNPLYDSILNHEKSIDLDVLLNVQKEIDQDPNHYQINDVLDELEKQAREIGLMI